MKFSATLMVLATVAIESASAGTMRHAHQHAHAKKDATKVERGWVPPPGYDYHTDPAYLATVNNAQPTAAPAADPVKSTGASLKQKVKGSVNKITSKGSIKTTGFGASTLVNSAFKAGEKMLLAGTSNGATDTDFVWVGESGGAYSNQILNKGKTDYTVAFIKTNAGPLGQAQWLDQFAPALTISIPAGSKATIQYAHGANGIFVPISADATYSEYGLLEATIGEFNIDGQYPTFDVSREWYADGSDMTIHGRGNCVSSTIENTCAFVCTSFEYGKTCGDAGTYDLVNTSVDENCHKGFTSRQDKNQVTHKVAEGGCFVDKEIITELF